METNTILLVDDEEDIRLVLKVSLEDMGYTVYTAENGEEGYRIFEDINPPLVLTDIKMPGMDGIELLRKIKQKDPEAEVLMITGHGDMDLAITSFKDEASDFITKPIDVDALEVALQRVKEKIQIRKKLRDYTQNLESLLHQKTKRIKEMEHKIEDSDDGQTSWSIQSRFQEHFDKLPCYITIQDRKLRFISLNSRFREDFGDQVGSYCYAVWKQRNNPCAECPVLQTFEDGETHQQEMELIAKSARRYNVMVWTTPIRDDQGQVTQVLVMATNLEQFVDLQDHLSSLGLMIGSVSHGIKGLLTALDGGMYLLESGLSKKEDSQINEGLEITKKMVSRIRNLVLDILFYAKDRDLNRETIDVESFASDLAGVAGSKMKRAGIKFSAEFESSLGEFSVDVGFLNSALINILENAVDACNEDDSKSEHAVSLVVRRENQNITFVIEDNGIGMDRQTRENMFDLFFSAKGKMGTGLGLFIANKIVKQHEGHISVNSTKGKGTQINVTIPVESNQTSESNPRK